MKFPCRDDPEKWVDKYAEIRRQAAKLCAPCPDLEQCLAGAIERRETAHVWGGHDFGDPRTRPALGPKALAEIKHGTTGGARAHYRRGESPCEECRKAANRVRADRKRAA